MHTRTSAGGSTSRQPSMLHHTGPTSQMERIRPRSSTRHMYTLHMVDRSATSFPATSRLQRHLVSRSSARHTHRSIRNVIPSYLQAPTSSRFSIFDTTHVEQEVPQGSWSRPRITKTSTDHEAIQGSRSRPRNKKSPRDHKAIQGSRRRPRITKPSRDHEAAHGTRSHPGITRPSTDHEIIHGPRDHPQIPKFLSFVISTLVIMASGFTPKYYPLNPDGTVCRTPKTKAKKDEKVKSKKGDQGISTNSRIRPIRVLLPDHNLRQPVHQRRKSDGAHEKSTWK